MLGSTSLPASSVAPAQPPSSRTSTQTARRLMGPCSRKFGPTRIHGAEPLGSGTHRDLPQLSHADAYTRPPEATTLAVQRTSNRRIATAATRRTSVSVGRGDRGGLRAVRQSAEQVAAQRFL